MKTILIIAVALFTTCSASFAQKAKQNIVDTSKRVLYTCPMHPDITSNKPGTCSKCGMELQVSKKEAMKMDVVKYTCPMHPNVISDKPGKCPECGTTLNASPKEKMKMDAVKFTCPMHPDVSSKTAGKCPKCGMALTKTNSAKSK